MINKKKFQNFRIYFLFIFFILLGAAIIGRLFVLQIRDHEKYKALAENQHLKEEIIYAKRGKILYSDETTVLAENQGVQTIAVAPGEVKDFQKTAEVLSSVVEMSKEEILKKISNKDIPWVILKNNVPLKKTEGVEKLVGVHFVPSFNRFYPQGDIASHIVGFYGFDKDGKTRIGQYGVEEYYQKQLAGKDGFRKGAVDANQRPIFSLRNKIQEPVDGDTLVLTIDLNIQMFIENKVKELIEKYDPLNATIVVLSPKTGEILAMATLPNFDPNNYKKEKDKEVFKNPAILAYEPGSIFKPITAAAGIEEKVIMPQTTYYDSGEVKIGNYTIKNSDLKAHGQQTMTNVIELSLNTGAVFIQQKLGRERFASYVQKFGFGKKTGIDLTGEESGNLENILNPPSTEKLIEPANASFGQGITATPIQLLTAFSAIANQGQMVKPFIVKKIIHPNGKEEEIQPEVLGQPISAETASRVTAMMVSSVKNGYSKKAGVDGYLIAGKTGTAQAPWSYLGIKRAGYSDVALQSFINFAPAFNPEFILFLKMDGPKKGPRFSADSLAPMAKDINQYLFSYLGIPPEK